MGLVDKYVYFWQVRGLGKGQFTQFLDLLNFNFVAMLLILLKAYFPGVDSMIIWIFVLAIVIETTGFFGGVILERKYHLINSQQKFSNTRNDELQEILVRLRRMEALMKK